MDRLALRARRRLAAVVALVVAMAAVPTACGAPASPGVTGEPPATSPSGAPPAIVVAVHRTATCGCCREWESYLREYGATVRAIEHEDLVAFKNQRGVPEEMRSCHTAIVEGYFVEGHVPIEAIQKLLAERPAIDGIALPGMPAGSPGMGGEKEGPWVVYAVTDGSVSEFGTY